MKTISIEFTDEAYELVEKTAKEEYMNTPEKLVEFLMMRNLNALIHFKDDKEPEALDMGVITNSMKSFFDQFSTPTPTPPAPQTE